MMEKIESFEELKKRINTTKKSMLLLYKSENEQSRCAYDNLHKALKSDKSVEILTCDVACVKDVHGHFGISTVPSLLLFENGIVSGVIKGCHEEGYYRALKDGLAINNKSNKTIEKPTKKVVVYSTPTCSWCNTLKTWLDQNKIHYTDIDISADHRVAAELVKRSGQQGVPQTDINGKIVVGFDQTRLRELLDIR